MFVVNVFIGPLFGGYISHIGNYRTAEIECFVFVVENDLRRVGIGEGLVTFGCLEGAHKGRYLGLRRIEASDEALDLFGFDKRFVPLNVDDYVFVSAQTIVGFEATVCSATVFGRCHDNVPAERFHGVEYSVIVSGDTYIVEDFAGLLVDSLNHIFPFHVGQRFPWESGRGVASRNNTDEFHIEFLITFFYLISIT